MGAGDYVVYEDFTRPGWFNSTIAAHGFPIGQNTSFTRIFGNYQCLDDDSDGYSGANSYENCGLWDCNDTDNQVYPGAAEICNDRIDNDCDFLIDHEDSDCIAAYCGDGIKNQEWEQCDTAEGGCTKQCQSMQQTECSDLVLAKVSLNEIINQYNGNTLPHIYLGTDSSYIPQDTWFPLYLNGAYYTDSDISTYQDVPGIAVQRLGDGRVRLALHGSQGVDDYEYVDGAIEFYNATINEVQSDTVNNNKLEGNWTDGSGIGTYVVNDDELWASNMGTHSNFSLGVNIANDVYYTSWQIIRDCRGSICGYKFQDSNENGIMDDENGLGEWAINLIQFDSCQEGDEWADGVAVYAEGTTKNGTVLPDERTYSLKAVGEAQYPTGDPIEFVSLGFRGSLVLSFANIIVNGSGDDVEVAETSYNNPLCSDYREQAEVYAAQQATGPWVLLGTACQDGTFDLGDLAWAKYIKLVDISNPDDFTSPEADGFDVDAVRALNCSGSENIIDTQTTNPNGYYCFENLEDGQYRVQEVMQSGWINVTPLFQDILLENGNGASNINFGNIYEIPIEPESICGYKFHDYNQNGIFDENEPGIPNWNIFATNGEISYSPTQTVEGGYYCFNSIEPGLWTISEEIVNGWKNITNATQTIELLQGQQTEVRFGNYWCVEESCDQLDNDCDGKIDEDNVCQTEPYCGDGYCNGNEACSTCRQDCGVCEVTGGGGGGGGGGTLYLYIHNEAVKAQGNGTSVLVTWLTNLPATTRLAYDTISHPSLGDAPNYGYQWSTVKTDIDPRLTSHSVLIEGLLPDTTYYFLPIASASPEVFGKELSYKIESAVQEQEEQEGEVAGVKIEAEEEQPSSGSASQSTGSSTGGSAEGTVAGVEFAEAQEPEVVNEEEPVINEEPIAETATETPNEPNCLLYIWILLVLNALAVGGLWYRHKDNDKKLAKRMWILMLALIILPLIIAYPACWLRIWLIITLIASIILIFLVGKVLNKEEK